MNDNTQNQSPMNGPGRGRAALAQAEGVARTFALMVEVFFRHNFGQRYFSLMGVYGKLAFYALLLVLAFKASEQLDTLPLGAFFLASLTASLWHLFVIWRRSYRGERWHSRYSGTSWLASILPMSECTIKRWVEPLVVIMAGVMLASFNQALGGWLVFAGTCLGVTEALAEARFRTMILDAIDKDIEARNMRAALIEQKSAQETEGFVIPVGGMKPQQRESVFNGLTSLYERAKDAITTPQGGRCARCGAWNLAEVGYCGNCGQSPSAVVAAPAQSASIHPPRWTASG